MSKYVVAPVDELPSGTQRLVVAGGREIAVFNVEGTFYALRNQCPHQGGPLCSGFVAARLESPGPGRYNYDEGRKLVKCPWHGWEFDLATGQSWFDPTRRRVRAYPVAVESGETVLAPGPYVAETVPVRIEDDYVVIEVAG